MQTPHNNIFLIGPMGAGKTSVGRFLAKKLYKVFYDSDAEIERQTGVSLSWICDVEGQEGFRQREIKMIRQLVQLNNIVLATGGNCISSPEIRAALKENGLVIHIHISLQAQLERLKNDKKRPLLQGQDSRAMLMALWEECEAYYHQLADWTIPVDGRSLHDVCHDIWTSLTA